MSSYFASVSSIAIFTVFVKLVAALKEIVIAYRYGVSDVLDAYLIAFMYASFMVTILGGSFSSALVPTYVAVRLNQGRVAAQALLAKVTGWSGIIFITAAIVLAALSFWLVPLVGSGFDEKTLALTLKMVPILLPVMIFFGLSSIWSPVINSHGSFKFPALTPIFPSLGIIVFIYLCPASWGGYALALGSVIGYFLEMIVLGVWLQRFDLSPIPSLEIDNQLKTVGILFLPLLFSAMMNTGMGIVDQSMAAMLEKGSVAVLNYGYRVVGIIFSFSAAIWIVALPKFSKLAAAKDYSSLRSSMMQQIRAIMTLTIPLVIILILLSNLIVKILFERGAFTSEDTQIVALIQSFYLIQTPFYICSGLIVRMLSSLNQNKILIWGGAMALGANIVLNLLLMKIFRVAGIALSTSFVSVITFCFLLFALNLKLKKHA